MTQDLSGGCSQDVEMLAGLLLSEGLPGAGGLLPVHSMWLAAGQRSCRPLECSHGMVAGFPGVSDSAAAWQSAGHEKGLTSHTTTSTLFYSLEGSCRGQPTLRGRDHVRDRHMQ